MLKSHKHNIINKIRIVETKNGATNIFTQGNQSFDCSRMELHMLLVEIRKKRGTEEKKRKNEKRIFTRHMCF